MKRYKIGRKEKGNKAPLESFLSHSQMALMTPGWGLGILIYLALHYLPFQCDLT